MPLAQAEQYCAVAVPALVRQLAEPTSLGELNARWDMCRQLYISQTLTDPAELLRTDLGWPERRYYLTQKIIGDAQLAALASGTPTQPGPTLLMLGYLTVLALATLGEYAYQSQLDPAAMGSWLSEQQVPAVATAPPQLAPNPVPAPTKPASAVPGPANAVKSPPASKKVKVGFVVGIVSAVLAGGGYLLLSEPANATKQEASAPAPLVASPVAEPVPSAKAPAASTLAASSAAPAPAGRHQPGPAAKPAAARPALAGAGLPDTVGNAEMAQQIGGSFSAATGRYAKGEGQPLTVKLVAHTTLTVGINSTESLLYKRLASSQLTRPSSIALDRLTFDTGQAKLGAEGAQQLGNIASLLKTFPQAHLLVVGHASSREPEAIRLGLLRATAAVEELTKQGVGADRLQTQGVLTTGTPAGNDPAIKQAMTQGISLSISKL